MAPKGKQLEAMSDNVREEMVYGIRPLTEAVRAGRIPDRVLIRKGLAAEGIREMTDLLQKHRVPVQHVPEEALNRITRQNHQGVVGFMPLIGYVALEEVLDLAREKGKDPFVVMLDRITDVRNFGAVARTAECAGVDALVIPERGGARITADAIKASAGALLRITVCRSSNLYKSGVMMLEHGLSLVAATEKAYISCHDTTLTGPLCVIMGSEEDGVSSPLLKMSTARAAIPMYGSIGSLNVSVAAGIVLFEAARQRAGLEISKPLP
jgi:23S rRNA (guanosine2251-2'-O)-methyltransferase